MMNLYFLSSLAALFLSSISLIPSMLASPMLASPALTSPVLASDMPDTVVELFTSQGCSSCPPANKFVSSLAGDADKLVLSYGVTYWDYLGWKDTFGALEFTNRQRQYGKALGAANIYTPQIILNGETHRPRFSRTDVQKARLSAHRPEAELVNSQRGLILTLDEDIDHKNIRLTLVRYSPGPHHVPVARGENRGRTLTLSNVVQEIKTLAMKDISSKLSKGEGVEIGVMARSKQHYAVLVHDIKTAAIITAAAYRPIL